jgi:hypothetical protein
MTMGWLLRPKTLGVPVSQKKLWVSFVVVVAICVAAIFAAGKVPGGSIAIVLGLAWGYWLSLFILMKLSRDIQVSAIAGFTGMSAEGLLSGLSGDLGSTFTGVEQSLLKLAGVLGPAVLAAIKASGFGTPPADTVSTGVVAFLVIFLVRLYWTLPDNPPSVESVVAKPERYTQEERVRIAKAYPPA